MKTPALIIIKPEGLYRSLVGDIINKFNETGLDLIALRLIDVPRQKAEEHYQQLQDKPFFKGVINHLMGKYHDGCRVVVMVYYGRDAIKKCRKLRAQLTPKKPTRKASEGLLVALQKKGYLKMSFMYHLTLKKQEGK